MAIDFTLSPELEDLRLRVRDFIQQVVKPGEAQDRRPRQVERGDYIRILIEHAQRGRAAGLWLPHMPAEWGGMGLGHVELAMVQAEAAKSYYGPWVLNCQAPDEGNMHTLLHWATDAQKEKYLRPLCDGIAMSCFAMTEPEVAGSDPTLIQTRAVLRRRPLGHQRAQVVHLQRPPRRVRHPHRPHRGQPRPPAGGEHRLHRRHPVRGLEPRARGRDHARRDRPLRDPHREPARPGRATCSAAAARATASASTASARPAWRTACAGSRRPRRRST